MWRSSRGARIAGLGLMGVALAKLFIVVPASISSLYRIAMRPMSRNDLRSERGPAKLPADFNQLSKTAIRAMSAP